MGIIVKVLFVLLLFTGSTSSQTHPRLFYGPSDVATLQSRATTPGRYLDYDKLIGLKLQRQTKS